jgi:hypothetical protein
VWESGACGRKENEKKSEDACVPITSYFLSPISHLS